jgi:molecular chaperone DnaK
MQSNTVDFGIDLGTTNSVLAHSGRSRVEIVKNRFDNEITPSAVAYTTTGQVLVGQDALDKLHLCAARQFKRKMGADVRIPLFGGLELSPEQLSAEVLKELKALARIRFAVELEHAVITVPAMFRQPQCDATLRAAELAGISAATLLQEPIAAATAYLNDDPSEGNYIVFDLGGGTFDVSIVGLRDGEMTVLGHGGDNFLGGADMDRLLVEWVLGRLNRAHGAQHHLEQGPGMERLRRACERARQVLSIQETASIDLSEMELPIAAMPLTRPVMEDLISPIVSKTIAITRDRLEQASLTPRDINRILLVGGPTRTPYLRARLSEELDVPIALEDPMTVVARGAAIHASGLLKPQVTSLVPSSGRRVPMALYYDPVSNEDECTVAGKVTGSAPFSGEVRISRASGDWETGWIALRDGAFSCAVRLGRSDVNEYTAELRDFQGRSFEPAPKTVVIRRGIAAAVPVTPYNLGVALEHGEEFEVIVPAGQPLPAHGLQVVRAARTIAAGSGDHLPVYFLEGASPHAPDNLKVGELRISGKELTRTLREGERVEVRLRMDESRKLTAHVLIPVFDLDFVVELVSRLEQPPIDDLSASLAEASEHLSAVEGVVGPDDEPEVLRAKREIEQMEAEVEDLRRTGSSDNLREASHLSDLKARVRAVTDRYGTQAAYDRACATIESAESIASESLDSLGVASAADLRGEADRCLRIDDRKGLAAVEERASDIYWLHYRKKPECWIGFVTYLRENRALALEPLPYHEYVTRAEACLAKDDFEGVRLNGFEACRFLPESEATKNRFYDAGIRR